MSDLSTLPKGDSAWLLRKAIERIIQQVSVLETNIGSSTTGNSANTQIIFNDNGTLRGDTGLVFNKTTDALTVAGLVTAGSATITGALTVDTTMLVVDAANDRVGIGTASPIAGSRLDVRSAIGTGTDIQSLTVIDTSPLAINNGGGLSMGYVFQAPSTVIGRAGYIKTIKENATDNNYASAMVFGVTANGVATAERMRIDSSGNVGVGITPSAWATTTTIWRALDMQYSCGIASTGAGSGEMDFLWNAYYDQTDQRWEFKYTGDKASRYSIGGAGVHTWYNTASTGTANNPITWTTAMTLDASGRLGIGTASPNNTLTVRGTQDAGIEVNSADSNSSRLIFAYDPANTRWYINSTLSGSGTTLPLAFLIQNTEALRLNTTGNLVLKGGTIGATGVGITFPATQVASSDANCLDDYEEGTWTPVATGLTNVGAVTYTATYTKIGRVVYINLKVSAVTSTTSVANTTYFSGLPFNPAQNSTVTAVNEGNITSLGVGLIATGSNLFAPSWTAVQNATLSGFYYV